MLRLMLLFLVVALLPVSFSCAQASSPGQPVVLRDGKLPPGRTVTDSKGRVIHNGGLNENGKLNFRYSGKLTVKSTGDFEVSGEIPEVTNPASQGSDGPIDINTNGEPTTINLNRNGIDPNGHITTNVSGGNSTVNVNGNFNDPSVGGTNNTVNINGNNNSGSGNGANSGGTVNLGGHGNSWGSGGGQWSVHN